VNIISKFRAKAASYAQLAQNAHSHGERELMRRLELSCLSLARTEERGLPETNTERSEWS
jgi:hypothetical protein